jgi:hypothetical protein
MSEIKPLVRIPVESKELRKWAVEQAVKWPQITMGGGSMSQTYTGIHYVDADVIGRAKRLVAYVLDLEENRT